MHIKASSVWNEIERDEKNRLKRTKNELKIDVLTSKSNSVSSKSQNYSEEASDKYYQTDTKERNTKLYRNV